MIVEPPSGSAGRFRCWAAPVGVALVSLLASLAIVASAGSLRSTVADELARGVGGCDSLVEVDRRGTLIVVAEVNGGPVETVGSCPGVPAGTRAELDPTGVILADASGDVVGLDRSDPGRVIQVGDWSGRVLGTVVVEPGPLLLRVEGDGVVAVGLDPDAVASRRRGTGVAVLLGGLALAALIAVSGRRRRDPVATATAEVVWGPPQGPRLG